MLSGNASSIGDYFKAVSPPPYEIDVVGQAFFDMMKKGMEGKNGTPAASEKDVQPRKTDDDDADLVFKMDMDG